MKEQVTSIFYTLGTMVASAVYYDNPVVRADSSLKEAGLSSQVQYLIEELGNLFIYPDDGLDDIWEGFKDESRLLNWKKEEVNSLFEKACLEFLHIQINH